MSAEAVRLVVELVSLVLVAGGILTRLSAMATRFELIGTQQAAEISEMKNAIKELVAQTNRIDRVEERQLAEGRRIDELARRMNRYADGIHEGS